MTENSTSVPDNVSYIGGVLRFYLVGLALVGAGALVMAATFGEKVAFGVTPVLAVIWAVSQLMPRNSNGVRNSNDVSDSDGSEVTDPDIEGTIASVLAEVRNLRIEMKGRLYAGLGFIMGELSIQSESEEDFDADLLQQAIDLNWRAYKTLRGLGMGEYTALNNLIFYLSIQGEEGDRDFVLAMVEEIRCMGEKYNNAPFLLTYCRAILRYGGSPEELAEVRNIAAKYQFDPKVRSEARHLRANLIDFKDINPEGTPLPESDSYRGSKRK